MGQGRGEWAWAGAATDHPPPLPPSAWPGSLAFEAVSTQALELIFAGGHARGATAARLALTRGAVVALPNAPAAQEAVGEVQTLSIH